MDFESAAADAVPEELYHPPKGFRERALIRSREEYDALYRESIEDPENFWSKQAEPFHWERKWTAPFCEYNFDMRKGPIVVNWFTGAQTNVSYNALDRHVKAGRGDKVAFYWEGNDVGISNTLTYKDLLTKVCKIANFLKSEGVKAGDTVSIYLPMITELPAAMLACARIGAVHSVVFAGFSAESLGDRLIDSRSRVLLTATGVLRGTKLVGLKQIVDEACERSAKGGHTVEKVVVYDNATAMKREDVQMVEGRDVWWQDAVEKQEDECEVVWMDAEAPLFMLYTSGSTGTPKGVQHTTAGYMVGAATTFKYIFDYHDDDVYWCTADCGWITGHSYMTYGPLLNGATCVVFEGIPTHPDAGRSWEIVDKYKVTVFYTAPTAIRALMRCGDEFPEKHSLASLRLLGSVGEPINPEAWRWYHSAIGHGKCPIVDTWWQTETGGIMITPLPGAWPLKPGSATLPFFGVQPAIVDEHGNELEGVCNGYLCIKRAWPSCMRTVRNDHARFEATYFQAYKGYYFTGDGCRRDEDGYYWLTGRVDDVINVSGHRIGTAEVESALVAHDICAEAAVVGYEHPIKGQGIYAFVSLMEGVQPSEQVRTALKAAVRQHIGAFATPDVIHWAPGLPKTRSGKIMRRILRKIASGELDALGDISTLADPSVVEVLVKNKGL
ncbi:AMP-dependent synthetase and ligase family protein [Klebsormidium nitens]|uniref:acetate--CoA ligase n=1 Tax=Klebsormidium nitens TaxID=105231 RepID=A0A1Y1HXU5_KLENI|nr:AMP-dependent synthetase and ligase family protein [Klebsormidium nitens]|eukprot:GAQ82983.1 AMP-dependent synthetase and ligase family protein [Klebsormidium nitens]